MVKQIKKNRELVKFKEFLGTLDRVYTMSHINYYNKKGVSVIGVYDIADMVLLNKSLRNYYNHDDIFEIIREFTKCGNYKIGWKL